MRCDDFRDRSLRPHDDEQPSILAFVDLANPRKVVMFEHAESTIKLLKFKSWLPFVPLRADVLRRSRFDTTPIREQAGYPSTLTPECRLEKTIQYFSKWLSSS